MRTKIFSLMLVFVALLGATKTNAKVYERIELKDGSILAGQMISQIPGKSITFSADASYLVVPISNVSLHENVKTVKTQSDARWKQCTQIFPAFFPPSEKDLLNLREIRFSSSSNDALESFVDGFYYVYEKGNNITLIDAQNKTYTIALRSIKKIEKEQSSNRGSLFDVIVKKDNSEIKGFIISNEIGVQLKIKNVEANVIEVVPYNNIASQKKEALDSNRPICSQADFLDEICFKDGKSIRCVIVEQPIGKDYLWIVNTDNVKTQILTIEIICISKIENTGANQQGNKKSNRGNKSKEENLSVQQDNINDPYYPSDPKANKIYRQDGCCYVVALNKIQQRSLKNHLLEVESSKNYTMRDYCVVPVTLLPNSQKCYGFAEEDLDKIAIRSINLEDTSVEGRVFYFAIKTPGVYLIFDKKRDEGRLIEIK